jgi:hypothetical protein
MSKARLLLVTLAALVTALGLDGLLQFIRWAQPLTLAIVAPGGKVPPADRALRPIYPYSVIPGGAYSPDELRNAISKDSVVRDHYKDFDVKVTRLVTLSADRYQSVSYRIKNKVYWTRRKIRIPKGEVLLTDGIHFARTRCGNRLCAAPLPQTTFSIAPLKALSLPPFTPQLLAKNELMLPAAPVLAELPAQPGLEFELPRVGPYVPPTPEMPGNTAENWPPIEVTSPPLPIIPGYPILPGSPPPVFSPQPPPVVAEVPEPSSIYLFIAASAVSLWLMTRWIREDRNANDQITGDEN